MRIKHYVKQDKVLKKQFKLIFKCEVV